MDKKTTKTNIVEKSENRLYNFLIILIFLLGTSASTVYFIRKSKITSKIGDDFEILDE